MCLGMAAVPFFLSMVFLQSDCGVPLVTITSSPAGVHSSLDLSPGFGFRPSASITFSGTWVVPPLFRIVSARRRSLAKSAKLGLRHHVSDEIALIGLTLDRHV